MGKVEILTFLLKDELKDNGVNYLLKTGFSDRPYSYDEYKWEAISRQDEVSGDDVLIGINTYQAYLILRQIVLGRNILNEKNYGEEYGIDYTHDYSPEIILI